MQKQSLLRYLNRRYVVIMTVVIGAFIFLISFMNWSGMDDTTKYYMAYEAEVLTEYYQPFENIREFDSGQKEYYWQINQMPELYQEIIKEEGLVEGEAELFVRGDRYIYILPFPVEGTDAMFYVVHLFTFDEYAQNNLAVRLSYSFASFALLVVIVSVVIRLNRHVTNQISYFDRWVKQITQKNSEEIADTHLPEKVTFTELVETADSLKSSLVRQYELQEIEVERVKRERDFLTSLSHELRTPIAVISAAVSLLKKRDQLSEKDMLIVGKLARANGNMKTMTNTLLHVWRRQKSVNQKEMASLVAIFEQVLDEQKQINEGACELSIDIRQEQRFELDTNLIEMTFINLLRNAFQYAEGGEITVVIDNNRFSITNQYDHENRQMTNDSYGFGFGLYLVETICAQENWLFNVDADKQMFSISITFNLDNQDV